MTTIVLGPGIGSTGEAWDLTVDEGPTLGVATGTGDSPGLLPVTLLEDHTGLPLVLSVYTPDRTFLAYLPRRSGVQGAVEHNGTGSGQAQVRGDDPLMVANPDLWAAGNLVAVHYGDRLIHAWIMERDGDALDDTRAATWSQTGRGDLGLLDYAVLYPEGEVNRDTSEDRAFNFGSLTGPWYVPSEWKRPQGVLLRQSDRWPLPRRWPNPDKVRWLWSSNPERRSRAGDRYFRATLTVNQPTRLRVWAVADEDLLLMLNGAPLLRQRLGQWRKARARTVTLRPGTHQFAARVGYDKDQAFTTDEPGGGFAFMAARVDRKNRIERVLLRSTPGDWKVTGPRDDAPGWFPAQVLQTFVTEAQDRGVEGFDGITLGFTATHDSAGKPWQHRLAQTYKVGTGGLDLMRQLVERGMDVAMTGDGTLHVWRDRGTDRSHTVGLDGYVSTKRDVTTSAVVNTALSRWRRGWAEFSDDDTGYGRREQALSSGGSDDRGDARAQAAAAFREYGDPTATIEVVTNSLTGPQPFYDYNVGDVVTAPLGDGTRGPCQVLAIGYSEGETAVEWSHQMYPLGE